MRQRDYKLSLFADDILLTLTHPSTSLPALHNTLSTFGVLSGFKINQSKTEALPINVSPDVLESLRDKFNYRWCSSSLKYLGVYITSSYSTLYQANFPPMFAEIARLFNLWTSLPISLLGRVNVLKMSILPKLLYLFETLPTSVPMSQLKNLQRRCLKFIWNNASHRIAQSVVFALKHRGGLAAPDIIKYYYANFLGF